MTTSLAEVQDILRHFRGFGPLKSLQYNAGLGEVEWIPGGRGTAYVIAASNAPDHIKERADAVATGTDDHTIINAALAAYSFVQLSEGLFTGGQIVLNTGNALWGSGLATEYKAKNSFNSNLVVLANTSTEWVTLAHLVLDGNKANQSSGKGIVFTNTGGSFTDSDSLHHIERVHLRSFKDNGVEITDCHETRFHRVTAYSCNGHGFNIVSSDCFFDNCTAGLSGLHGFRTVSTNNVYVNCKSFGSGQVDSTSYGDGFYTEAEGQLYNGCYAQDNKRDGFTAYNTNDISYGACRAESNQSINFNFDTVVRIRAAACQAIGTRSGGPYTTSKGVRTINIVSTPEIYLDIDSKNNTTNWDLNSEDIALPAYKAYYPATSGNYIRGDGTDWASSAIQASDLPSHDHTKHDNRTRRIPLVTNATLAVDTHGSLGGSIGHYDAADGADTTFTFQPVHMPSDFASGALTFNVVFSSTVGGNNVKMRLGLYSLANSGATGHSVVLDSTAGRAANASANTTQKLSVTTSGAGTADTILEPFLILGRSDAVTDTNTGNVSIWDVYLEYSADM